MEMKEFIGWVVAFFVVIGLIFYLAIFGYIQEAKTFNKFTDGPKATWWDAAWSELRVDARVNSK